MISKQLFISHTSQEQKEYLQNLIGDISTDTNKALLLCQRLLQVIESPSTKVLEYMYDTINGQINFYHQNQQSQSQDNLQKLIEHIRAEEFKEQENIEDILTNL